MPSPFRFAVLFALLVAPFGPACNETTDVATIPSDGTLECSDLVTACHDAGEALHGRYDECHEIGHANDGEACLEVYEECMELCANAPLGEGGAGGEAPHEAGAGGQAEGGAHH